jgi:hypothetical protein
VAIGESDAIHIEVTRQELRDIVDGLSARRNQLADLRRKTFTDRRYHAERAGYLAGEERARDLGMRFERMLYSPDNSTSEPL